VIGLYLRNESAMLGKRSDNLVLDLGRPEPEAHSDAYLVYPSPYCSELYIYKIGLNVTDKPVHFIL
jgi:hypothetical protein